MKRSAVIALFLFSCFWVAAAGDAEATDIRGRIDSVGAYNSGVYPAAGVQVQLLAWNGGAWVPVHYAFTDNRGFYYFRGVRPGRYALSVANRSHTMVTVANIQAQDFAPFLLG